MPPHSSPLQICRRSDSSLLNTSSCGMTIWGSGPWWRGWRALATLRSSSLPPHKAAGWRSAHGALMPPRTLPVAVGAHRVARVSGVSVRRACAASAGRTERARRSTRATGWRRAPGACCVPCWGATCVRCAEPPGTPPTPATTAPRAHTRHDVMRPVCARCRSVQHSLTMVLFTHGNVSLVPCNANGFTQIIEKKFLLVKFYCDFKFCIKFWKYVHDSFFNV